MSEGGWKSQPIDGGVLAFDRRRGVNLLIRNDRTVSECRKAPRSLQVGLLTPCNLSCGFCYRDTRAPSRLTAEFLVDLLTKAAEWGVLEVSFGGGEPLLFKDFVTLVRRLHEQTSLGINFTTNGTLLTSRVIKELGEAIGEIRISAYLDNHYRSTLRLISSRQGGLNLLVTPANLGVLEVIVKDAIRQGARNVLLLSYKGHDDKLHLSVEQLERLRHAVLRMQHLPLRLDICWYPLLSDLPHLFPRTDCGAGDEFLVITPDRAIQPCSFHHEKIPFETFDDLQRIYAELRQRRPPTTISGCTRQQFVPPLISLAKAPAGIWLWQARSSNNSGDWTIIGRFRSAELAEQAAEALRRLSRAHEAFVASPEGQAWIEDHDYNGSIPTPPVQQFGEAHGFEWREEGEGLWWEEEGCGAPVLTAGAVGNAVVVYHPYCMGLPEEPFRKFFAAVGATEFGYWQYDRPCVIATAYGSCPAAIKAIEHYFELIESVQYPSQVTEPPPWGAECGDPRLLDDEDRSARLASGTRAIQLDAGRLRVILSFENTFAGALAIEQWLCAKGYHDVTVQVEYLLESLQAPNASALRPNTELFSEVQPIHARIAEMSHAELIDAVFTYYSEAPAALEDAVASIPVEERLRWARNAWQQRREQGVDVHRRALMLIENAGPAAADWLREMLLVLRDEDYRGMGIVFRAMAKTLHPDESFRYALEWLAAARDRSQYTERLKMFSSLGNPRTVELIEDWWENSDPNAPVTGEWSLLAAASQIDWPTLRRWLERGRPLALIALAVLEQYAAKGTPASYTKPQRGEFIEALTAYQSMDPAPRAATSVNRVIAATEKLTVAEPQ